MANNKPFAIYLSGKGFTSPKVYYSKLSNSIEADDYYTLKCHKNLSQHNTQF